MRHRKSGRKLGRSWEHRKAMFRNMARSLVVHESIRTTEARAKELRKVADRLVTLALRNDVHSRRQAYKVLGDHAMVKRLFDDIGPRFAGISGGFTRVVKLGHPRPGDAAPMAVIEFSLRSGEKPEEKESKKPAKAAKKSPARKPGGKKAAQAAEEAPETASAEKPEAEEPVAEAAPAEEPVAEAAPTEEASAEEPEEEAEEPEPEADEAQEASGAEEAAEESQAEGEEPEAPEGEEKK